MTIQEQINALRMDIFNRIAPFMAHEKQELNAIKWRLHELCAIAKRVVLAEAMLKQISHGALQSAAEMTQVDEIEQLEDVQVPS